MCNLYSITTVPEAMRRLLNLPWPLKTNLEPRTEVWPTDPAPVVRLDEAGVRELATLRWWLVPRWAKELKSRYPMFNARGEEIDRKPAYRQPWAEGRRCLIPATRFFEHPAIAGKKVRYAVELEGVELFAIAGLWERNDALAVESFTMITVTANALVRDLHPKNRMPAILPPERYDAWLDPATTPADAQAMLATYPAEAMTARPAAELTEGEPAA